MLDVHVSAADKLPSSASAAVPLNTTVVPAGNEAPFDGDTIVTMGGRFGGGGAASNWYAPTS